MKPKVKYHFYKHAIGACRKNNIRHNLSKYQFDNMHLFYNHHIPSGTDILEPDKTYITFNISKMKDLVFQARAGHKRKVFHKIDTICQRFAANELGTSED